jgi:pimeloyl-ACP methyl ester carboxylesterase
MLQPDKKTAIVHGHRMAYREIGEGDPIIFAHGNPTSSYLWRNVMPHLEGLGRLIACDMIGMGDSDKLDPSGPDRYSYLEHRDYLFALWEQLGLQRKVILVRHDWGSALGFDWAAQHPDWIASIAYGEAVVAPHELRDWPEGPWKTSKPCAHQPVSRWSWRTRWLGPGLGGYRRADGHPHHHRDPHDYTELLCRLHPVGTSEHCHNTLTETARRTGISHFLLLAEGTGDRAPHSGKHRPPRRRGHPVLQINTPPRQSVARSAARSR